MAEQQPTRMCDVCGGVDDHPRHVYGRVAGDAQTDPEVAKLALSKASPDDVAGVIAHIQDNTTTMRHMDCCRDAGCPDGTCNLVTAGAEDKKGSALRKHLTSLDRPAQLEG